MIALLDQPEPDAVGAEQVDRMIEDVGEELGQVDAAARLGRDPAEDGLAVHGQGHGLQDPLREDESLVLARCGHVVHEECAEDDCESDMGG